MNKFDVRFAIEDAGFKLDHNVEDSNFYYKKDDIVLSYTVPHENLKEHMIRAEHVIHFDRWSNAEIELFVNNVSDLIDALEMIEKHFAEVPYSAEDYRLASAQGLDLDVYADWSEYFKMEDHAEDDVMGDSCYQGDR